MARIRSIKPDTWVDERFAECSPSARLTFIGMQNFCDDRGVHPAKPKTLKAELFPMDDITSGQVGEWVGELVAAGLVREFTTEETGDRYWHVIEWDQLQKIDRPSYKHPAPPALNPTSPRRTDAPSVRDSLDEDSPNDRRAPPPGVDRKEGKEGEEAGSPKARTRTQSRKATMPANFGISTRVQAWAAQKGFDRLPEHLEAFRSKAAAKGYTYADWDEALMGAIRDDWAGLRTAGANRNGSMRQPALACEEQIR